MRMICTIVLDFTLNQSPFEDSLTGTFLASVCLAELDKLEQVEEQSEPIKRGCKQLLWKGGLRGFLQLSSQGGEKLRQARLVLSAASPPRSWRSTTSKLHLQQLPLPPQFGRKLSWIQSKVRRILH